MSKKYLSKILKNGQILYIKDVEARDLKQNKLAIEGYGDDAARTNWGGDWRMPTTAEFQALCSAVNTDWPQVNNVYGILYTDKTDSSKTLFFPAAGYCYNGSVMNVGRTGSYWSSSLYTDNRLYAYDLHLDVSRLTFEGDDYVNRSRGCTVRPILDGTNANNHDYVEIGGIKWATMNIGANSVTDYGLYFQWGDTQGYTASQVGSGSGKKYFGWADYKYGNGTSSPGATGMTKYNSTDSLTTLELSAPVEHIHKIAVTGDYNDLTNTPTVPTTMVASGSNHAGGLVPDTPSTAGTTKFLREDGTWANPLSSGIEIASINASSAMSITADKTTVINGTVETATITLQVPNDNLAHCWDILMTTGLAVSITITTSSNNSSIYYPEGFVLGTESNCELNIIGVNNKFYLRYGEFNIT